MNNVSNAAPRVTSGRTENSGRPRSGSMGPANTFLFWSLLALLALAPLPFGSARPIFWGVWAIYIGVVGAIYFGMLALRGQRLRIGAGKLALAGAGFVLTCLYLIIQMVPIGEFTIVSADGVTLSAPHISIAPSMTFLMLVRLLTFGLFFLLIMQIAVNDNRRARLLLLLMLSVVAYGVYSLVALQTGDTILGLPKWAYQGSATGTFVNRNSFATFIGFGAILALVQGCAVIVRQSQRHAHDGHIVNYRSSLMLYGLTYAFLLVVLVATQSRMGLFATLVASLLVLLITALTVGKLRIAILAIPLGLVLLGGALYLIGGGLLERVTNLEFSAEQRGELYRQILDLIALRPWTGFGGGSFALAFPLVHELPVSPDVTWDRAHNTYLALWSELGLIVGSLPMLALAALGIRMVLALIRREGSWTAQTAGLGVLLLGAIHSLVDFSLEIEANTLLFLAIVGIGAATSLQQERKG